MTIRSYQGISPTIHHRVYIDQAAVVIGDVVIGEDSSVWPMTVIRGDVEKIRIGERTNLQDGCILHVTHDGDYSPNGFPLTIVRCGLDNVTIADNSHNDTNQKSKAFLKCACFFSSFAFKFIVCLPTSRRLQHQLRSVVKNQLR